MAKHDQPPGETPLAIHKGAPTGRRRGVKRSIFLVLVLLGGGALAHAWYWGSHVDPHLPSAAELEKGPRWQIVSWGEGRSAVQVSRLSSLAADHLWRVVTDQERFGEFLPYVRSTTVAPGPGGILIEKQILDLPHKSYELTLEIRLEEQGGARSARWRQTQGDLTFNEGAWVVETEGDRSILRYQVSASINWLPQWAVNYAMGGRLPRLLEAVEERVRDLEKRKPDYFRR